MQRRSDLFPPAQVPSSALPYFWNSDVRAQTSMTIFIFALVQSTRCIKWQAEQRGRKSSTRKVVPGLGFFLLLFVCFLLLSPQPQNRQTMAWARTRVRVCVDTRLCNPSLFWASYFDRYAWLNASLMALAYVPANLCAVSSDTLTSHISHAACYTLCHCQLLHVVDSGFSWQQPKGKKKGKKKKRSAIYWLSTQS